MREPSIYRKKVGKHVNPEDVLTGKGMDDEAGTSLTFTSIIMSRLYYDENTIKLIEDMYAGKIDKIPVAVYEVITGYKKVNVFETLKQSVGAVISHFKARYDETDKKIMDYLAPNRVTYAITGKTDVDRVSALIEKLGNRLGDIDGSFTALARGNNPKEIIANLEGNLVFHYYPISTIEKIAESIFKNDYRVIEDIPYLNYDKIKEIISLVKEYDSIRSKYMKMPETAWFM